MIANVLPMEDSGDMAGDVATIENTVPLVPFRPEYKDTPNKYELSYLYALKRHTLVWGRSAPRAPGGSPGVELLTTNQLNYYRLRKDFEIYKELFRTHDHLIAEVRDGMENSRKQFMNLFMSKVFSNRFGIAGVLVDDVIVDDKRRAMVVSKTFRKNVNLKMVASNFMVVNEFGNKREGEYLIARRRLRKFTDFTVTEFHAQEKEGNLREDMQRLWEEIQADPDVIAYQELLPFYFLHVKLISQDMIGIKNLAEATDEDLMHVMDRVIGTCTLSNFGSNGIYRESQNKMQVSLNIDFC